MGEGRQLESVVWRKGWAWSVVGMLQRAGVAPGILQHNAPGQTDAPPLSQCCLHAAHVSASDLPHPRRSRLKRMRGAVVQVARRVGSIVELEGPGCRAMMHPLLAAEAGGDRMTSFVLRRCVGAPPVAAT